MTQPLPLPTNQPFLPSPRFPKTLVLQVLELASGVQVVWSTARRNFLGLVPGVENAWIIVTGSKMSNEGTDEIRRQYNPATDQNQTIDGGQRSAILSLRAFAVDGVASIEPFDLLSRVRLQLRTRKCSALYAGTLALHTFGPINNLTDLVDEEGGRLVLNATMDVGIGYVDQADPVDPQEGGYIESSDAPNNGTLDGNAVGPLGPGA